MTLLSDRIFLSPEALLICASQQSSSHSFSEICFEHYLRKKLSKIDAVALIRISASSKAKPLFIILDNILRTKPCQRKDQL
jgi:hypothetical protein